MLTKEEIVGNLRYALIWNDKPEKEVLEEVLKIVIKALEQEPQTERIEYGTDGNPYVLSITNGKALEKETCNNAISRAEVHDLLATWLSDKLDEKTREVLEVIDGKVEDMPPVTPKQRTGHWISFGVQGEVDGQIVQGFTCSECGAISIFRMESGNIVNGDICPNCAAKMEEQA